MRLMLRYREVVGLGATAERLLRFGREVRTLRERLGDRATTWVGVVTLPEALPLAETRRLLGSLEGLGVGVDAIVQNRLLREGEVPDSGGEFAAAGCALAAGAVCAGAPALPRGPAGAAQLRAFAASWRTLALT
jgi:anion-transporting  ArsA/GET3 family ATPase